MSSLTNTWLVSSSVTGLAIKLKNNLPRVIFHNGPWGGGGRGAVLDAENWTWHLLEAEAIKENYRDGNLRRAAVDIIYTAEGWEIFAMKGFGRKKN